MPSSTPTMGTTTTTTSMSSMSANMAGNFEINNDESVIPTLEDLSEEDHAGIQAKTKELHTLMLGRYAKTSGNFVKCDTRSVTITMQTKGADPHGHPGGYDAHGGANFGRFGNYGDNQFGEHGGYRDRRRLNHEHRQDEDGLGKVKVSIPPFSGKENADAYFEWETKVDQIFDLYNYPTAKKAKLAAIEFKAHNSSTHWRHSQQRESGLHTPSSRAASRPVSTSAKQFDAKGKAVSSNQSNSSAAAAPRKTTLADGSYDSQSEAEDEHDILPLSNENLQTSFYNEYTISFFGG
ncbi:hypothetical protein GUJ93_ZPchr0006g41800 [Zizania palustris]|uniref:Uncharacterized protein n=1 Tax=Zizania palustris TaxID=103762 RepID=A0A8J5SNE5_ZIZPA|nr:hypothetical protein GUJ93_ZPchr0006g41800 [Zizania palustris]